MTPSFLAFGDELVKIAMLQKIRKGFEDAMSTGWHGYGPENSATRQTWMGMGKLPEAERAAQGMGRFGRAVDTATSLGGATKYLPVGAKSLMALGTYSQAKSALNPQDPTGQGRSRTERVVGLAGNTLGGLAATGALLNRARKSGAPIGGGKMLALNLLGGIGGGILGEKLVTAPWRNSRAAYQQHQRNQQQYYQQPQPGEVPA